MYRSGRRGWVGAALLSLVALSGAAQAQQSPATISGIVTRTGGGGPLPQATVIITSLGVSAFTRSDGRYTLVVPANRVMGQEVVITARLVGFSANSQRIQLRSGPITQNFELEANPFQLGEVVVTGAGTEAEFRALGVERKTVDSTVILRANETNIVQALAGKMPGVNVTQSTGEAGGNSRVQIRGIRSLSGSGQPLIVVDGLPINNSTSVSAAAGTNSGVLSGTTSPNRGADINPDDIASIEVLSGASASAVYGSGAANGVILITTKRGVPGRTSFSFRSTMQSDKPVGGLPMQTKYGLGTGGNTPACNPNGAPGCILNAGFFSWGPQLGAGTPTYDHSRDIYETGLSLDNALTLSGGNDRTTFLISGSYLKQDGFIYSDRDYYNKANVRLSGNHIVSERFSVNANAAYIQTSGNFIPRGNSVNGLLLGSLRTPPEFNNREYLTEQGLHRSFRLPNPIVGQERANRGFDNPFYSIFVNENQQRTGRYLGNLATEWKPMDWLRVNHTIGADFTSEDRMEARGAQSAGSPPASGSIVGRWQFSQLLLNSNLTATAFFNLNSNVNGSLLVGQELGQSEFRQLRAQGNNLVADLPYRIDNTVGAEPSSDTETKTRLEGYLMQGRLNLYDQLFLTGTIRNDGSSTFGTETNRAWYPGGSVAWNFTQAVLKDNDILSFGKLRGAYGEAGITPGPYQLQNVFLGGSNSFNDFNPGSTSLPSLGGNGGLYTAGGKGNPGLKPERTREIAVGTDLSFLNDRVDLSYTYYDTRSTDVILGFPLAPSTGFTSVVSNAAIITNKGHELQLNMRPVVSRNLVVDLSANWARNRNLVESLGSDDIEFIFWQSSFGGRTVNAQVGYPLGTIRTRDFARCGRGLTAPAGIEAACAGQPSGTLYIAANGFPVVDPTEYPAGDPNPDWTGGLRAGITMFQRLSITAALDIRQGGIVQNMTKASMYGYGTHKDTEIRGESRTFGVDIFPGQRTTGPGAGTAVVVGEGWFNGSGGIGGPGAQFNEDASYKRLREVSVSYLFDQPWVNRILGLRSMDLRISGRNLKTWTKYTGFDPETGLGGLGGAGTASQGFDWFNSPVAKAVVVSIGLNW